MIESTLKILKGQAQQEQRIHEYELMHQQDDSSRTSAYERVTNLYYDLVTDFYEYGWGESFHFAPRSKSETHEQALQRHEHYLAVRMGIQPAHSVLDVGCGIGGPARTIARLTGCRITGLNNNQKQIDRAGQLNKKHHLEKNVSLIKGDFMNIPCAPATYDHIYQIEATCHAPDHVGCYKELYRVLKPGGYFAGFEWAMTEKYDPSSPQHNEIKRGVQLGNGIANLISADQIVKNLKEAGFEVIEIFDYAAPDRWDVPWYDPLANNWNLVKGFSRTPTGRFLGNKALGVLEFLRLAPKGSQQISSVLNVGANSLIKGGQLGIFTPALFVLARKPLEDNADKKKGDL